MKCMVRIGAIVGVMVLWFSTGCGGGGGGNGGASGGQSQTPAPGSVSGKTLTLNGSLTRQIKFESSGNIWTEDREGVAHGGTYEYRPSGGSAELVLSESGVISTIRLTFSAADSGAFTAGNDQGAFRLEATQNPPADPGPLPSDPGGEGTAPSSLIGRTVFGTRTFTSTGPVGQTHVYTFDADSFHDSDPPEESDGTYTYAPYGNTASLILHYSSPQEFNGDAHHLALRFAAGNSGTFESVYTRRDGTTIQINGNFQVE